MTAARIRPWALLALLSPVLALSCLGLVYVLHPDSLDTLQIGQGAVSVMDDVSLEAVNAVIGQDGAFHPTDGDAQLYIRGCPSGISSLCVVLREPLPAETQCQLYYALEGERIAETNSTRRLLEIPEDRIVFRLPKKAVYPLLRLDIDRDYVLEDILISAKKASAESIPFSDALRDGRYTPPFAAAGTAFALFFCTGLMLMKRKKADKT